MKRALLNKCFLGLGLQILAVFPLAAQVDVDPLGDEPGRITFKDVNALGQAALKAVTAGDYEGLKRLTAYGLEQREWVTMGNEFLERAEAKAKADLKNDKGEEADDIRRKLQRMKEQFKGNKLDEAMKRVESKEKKYGEAFKKLKREGKAMGIDWTRVLFKQMDNSRVRDTGPVNVEQGDLYVIFSSGKKLYHLKLDDCLHSSRLGWLIGPGPIEVGAGMPADHHDHDHDGDDEPGEEAPPRGKAVPRELKKPQP
ncbi:uncharacterized protein METZ01_LOCUS318532, partial [marine metagenome]